MKTRRENLIRLMETFPKRKFILLGDISNSDIMSSYPEMTRLFPDQVQVRFMSCLERRRVTDEMGLCSVYCYETSPPQNLSSLSRSTIQVSKACFLHKSNSSAHLCVSTPTPHYSSTLTRRTQDDIAGIDFANGGCRNYTVPQNIPMGTVLPSLSQVKNAILEGNTPFGALKAAWSNLPSIF